MCVCVLGGGVGGGGEEGREERGEHHDRDRFFLN